jgi:hypothetical protein
LGDIVLSFRKYLTEDEARKDPKSRTLHAFDMDETLFTYDPTKLRIHVNDENGNRVHSLSNQEFNNHKLAPGHKYDFSEFRSSKLFGQTAAPIRPILRKLKAIHKNNKNVEILTARSDFDDKDAFMGELGKHGVDANQIHVRRAGNLGLAPPEAKRAVLSSLIKKHGYKKIHLYDDSKANLANFASLKQDHPDVELHAHHVHYDHGTGNVKVKTTVYK